MVAIKYDVWAKSLLAGTTAEQREKKIYRHSKNLKIKLSKTIKMMLTPDKLSAFDNMCMRMIDGDFKSCNRKRRKCR